MTPQELDRLIRKIETETQPNANTKERIAQVLKAVKQYAETTSVFAKNAFVFGKNLWHDNILHHTWAGYPTMSEETFNGFPIYKATRDWQGWNVTQRFTQPMVLSFYARDTQRDQSGVRILLNNGQWRNDQHRAITREFQRYVFKYPLGITPNSHGTYGISVHYSGVEIACIQLEEGTEATAYTPHLDFFQQQGKAVKLPSGTATTPPLIMAQGTTTTTPVNGALEFDGTNLYFTVNGRRRQIMLVG